MKLSHGSSALHQIQAGIVLPDHLFFPCRSLLFCLVLVVRGPFPMDFPQLEVHSHSFSRRVTSYLMGSL